MAVVGAGVAGLGAAFSLRDRHDVTLFDADERAGGHAKTVRVDYDGTELAADVGFMVFAPAIYPRLAALFADFGVQTRLTAMSFGTRSRDGFAWAWTGKRDPRSWLRNGSSPEHRRLFLDILRFNAVAKSVARSEPNNAMPLAAFLAHSAFTQAFAQRYALPLVCAIWSLPFSVAGQFPMGRLATFMDHHRLLSLRAHRWRSIVGGSATYVDHLLSKIDDVRLGTAVREVRRVAGPRVRLRTSSGREDGFDAVIFATHPDQTLSILADASAQERAVLSTFQFKANEVVLHRDASMMPPSRALWAAWNVDVADHSRHGQVTAVTYWLNRLQHISNRTPLFVTVNPHVRPAPSATFETFSLNHFQFDAAAAAAQARLPALQGKGGVWHCGAWTRDGFHEDGLTSGLAVAADVAAHWGARSLEGVS